MSCFIVNGSGTNVVYVKDCALKQKNLIMKYRDHMLVVYVFMAIGITIDFNFDM